MIIEKLNELCIQNGISLTNLCKEITGSSGNLPTWKKDKIRPDWLRAICIKFNISSDYLLELPHELNNLNLSITDIKQKALDSFSQLNEDNQDIIIGKMKELLKEQKYESVAADTNFKEAK